MLLLPESYLKPFRENTPVDSMLTKVSRRRDLHLCAYGLSFAIIPQELLDVFPLSQSVDALPASAMTISNASRRMVTYLKTAGYKQCVIVVNQDWQMRIGKSIQRRLGRKMRTKIIAVKDDDEESLSKIPKALREFGHRRRIS